jgi:putative membrane protein
MKRKRSFYTRFEDKDLAITDLLALDRTILANERNLLSYVRTFLSFFVTGLAVIRFAPSWFPIGIICMFTAIVFLLIGINQYRHMKEELSILEQIENKNAEQLSS